MTVHVVVLVTLDFSDTAGLVMAGDARSVVDEDVLGRARHVVDVLLRGTSPPLGPGDDVGA